MSPYLFWILHSPNHLVSGNTSEAAQFKGCLMLFLHSSHLSPLPVTAVSTPVCVLGDYAPIIEIEIMPH